VIENIQREFLKYLFFKEHKYYPPIGYRNELLWSEFNVLPLGIRRDLTALTVLHKIIHNKIDSSDILNKIDFLVPRIETRFPLTFAYTTPRTNALARSPIILMCSLYNSICDGVDIFRKNPMLFRDSVIGILNYKDCFCR
jgi:hypothetical protein